MTDDLPRLAARAAESHKGDYGHAVLIGGSTGMAGAIALAGMATLRSGAGLVTLGVPSACQDVVAGIEPSYMTVGLPSDPRGRIAASSREHIESLAAKATALACGPGLGISAQLEELILWLYQSVKQPTVIDADALNALAGHPEALARAGGPRILTPHPGEFARLVGGSVPGRSDREKAAAELARRCAAVVVLKGHATVVSDGERVFVNHTGNPGMATGGVGDVLTGAITGLLCQGLNPLDAARLAVAVHGAAGDLAAAELGQVSLIASDLVRFLPAAFQRLAAG